MFKRYLFAWLIPFIYYASFIIISLLFHFVVFPFIDSIFLPSESFYYPFFILSLMIIVIVSIPYFIHQVSIMKILKEGKACFAQVVGKSKHQNIEGQFTYFHAVGLEENKEFDFHLQIYPFTRTKVGNSYLIHFLGSEKKNKCFIMEDERILSNLFYSYTLFHFVVSVVISFFI